MKLESSVKICKSPKYYKMCPSEETAQNIYFRKTILYIHRKHRLHARAHIIRTRAMDITPMDIASLAGLGLLMLISVLIYCVSCFVYMIFSSVYDHTQDEYIL